MDFSYWAVGAAILFLLGWVVVSFLYSQKKVEPEPKARVTFSGIETVNNVRPIRPTKAKVDTSTEKRRADDADDDGYVDGSLIGQLTGVPFGRIPGPRRHHAEDDDRLREDKGSSGDRDGDPADAKGTDSPGSPDGDGGDGGGD